MMGNNSIPAIQTCDIRAGELKRFGELFYRISTVFFEKPSGSPRYWRDKDSMDRLGPLCLDIQSQDANQEEFPVASQTP
jgi:hypothetical protein